MRAPILILGIGNILMGDDGIGIHLIERISAMPLPKHIEIYDGGTSGADLLDIIAEREKVVIVDAVECGHLPGTIVRFTQDAIVAPSQVPISIHNLGIPHLLYIARLLGCEPKEFVFLGVQPELLSPGVRLSPNVQKILPDLVLMVLRECEVR